MKKHSPSASSRRLARLKPALERLYEEYNRRDLIQTDPLQFVYHYSSRADREIAGFLAAATEITESFAELEPADPVKYDFALSRIGIVENCDGSYRPACADCELLEFCRNNPYD